MVVQVVYVRGMRVSVAASLVEMPVGVLADHQIRMLMFVVAIGMMVGMFMLDGFVGVRMLMHFRHVQYDTQQDEKST